MQTDYHCQHPWICTLAKALHWLGSDLSEQKHCYQERFFCLYTILRVAQAQEPTCYCLFHLACPRNPQIERESNGLAKQQQNNSSNLLTLLKLKLKFKYGHHSELTCWNWWYSCWRGWPLKKTDWRETDMNPSNEKTVNKSHFKWVSHMEGETISLSLLFLCSLKYFTYHLSVNIWIYTLTVHCYLRRPCERKGFSR